MDIVLQHDLLSRMIEPHRREPAPMRMTQQKAIEMLPGLGRYPEAVARARTKSRIASCAASGTHTAVNSPARCSFANINASRRSVLTRSPALTGINEGATTMQSCPSPRNNRHRP
jgi:hypothetical protein